MFDYLQVVCVRSNITSTPAVASPYIEVSLEADQQHTLHARQAAIDCHRQLPIRVRPRRHSLHWSSEAWSFRVENSSHRDLVRAPSRDDSRDYE